MNYKGYLIQEDNDCGFSIHDSDLDWRGSMPTEKKCIEFIDNHLSKPIKTLATKRIVNFKDWNKNVKPPKGTTERYFFKPFNTIGLFGCYCHPFESYAEAKARSKQNISIGTIVMHRCTGNIGSIVEERNSLGFHGISYGVAPINRQNIHAENILIIDNK